MAIDCSVAYGEVTRVPWLRGELERSMQQHISSEFLWPRRVVVPAFREGTLNETVTLPLPLTLPLTLPLPLPLTLPLLLTTASDHCF